MSSQIEAAAVAVSQARANGEKARGRLSEAQAVSDGLKARALVLENERTEIIAATRRGDHNPEHALRIAVVDADLKDLKPISEDAAAGVGAALAQAQEASAALSRAEQMLVIATDEAVLGRLTAHATELDGLLLKTVTQIAAIVTRRGGRPVWYPSIELANTLHRLRLTANQVRR
jgi:hypothetical protein